MLDYWVLAPATIQTYLNSGFKSASNSMRFPTESRHSITSVTEVKVNITLVY